MRNTVIDPPVGLVDVKTYNGFEYDENREALKIAIRQCNSFDAIFRTIEALRTSTECGRDTVKELLLCACLEVGPANPSLIIMIDNIIGRDLMQLDYEDVIIATELISLSPKCRLFAWIGDYYMKIADHSLFEARGDNYDQALRTCLIYIGLYLDDRDFHKAVEEGGRLIGARCHVDKEMWKKLCVTCSNPSRAKHFSKPMSAIWIPILTKAERCGSQKVCNLVHRIYNIACVRSNNIKLCMREDRRVYSMCVYAMWILCNIKSVEDTWYEDGNIRLIPKCNFMSDDDRILCLSKHLNRKINIELPENALNMFTKRGIAMGLHMEHFIENSAIITNQCQEFREGEQTWLKRVRSQ